MRTWRTRAMACRWSGVCVVSGRNCVRKFRVNESGIRRCTLIGIRSYLSTAMRAALVAAILVITPIALTPVVSAHAATTSAIHGVPAAVRLRMAAWHWALRQRFKPYIWGGTGPYGFDCSGLVYAAYRASGMQLPRTTYEMLDSWRLVRISRSQARKGDLAFFGAGHVELDAGGHWTYGAEESGTRIGFHRMNAFWHPTMYFRVRELASRVRRREATGTGAAGHRGAAAARAPGRRWGRGSAVPAGPCAPSLRAAATG